jgi:predicted nuclease of predicted toxin-antitoxin system
VPEALRAAGHTVYLLSAVFGTGALDPDWLPQVGERGWVLITKDKNIRKRPIEMRAHMGTNVRSFVFTAGNMTGEQQGQLLVSAFPKILKILKRTAAPFIAHIRANADVAVLDLKRYLDHDKT